MSLNSQWLQLWNPSVVICSVVYLPWSVGQSVCLFAFFCSCHLLPPLPPLFLGVILNDFLVIEGGSQHPRIIFYSNGTQWKKESFFQVLPISIRHISALGYGICPSPNSLTSHGFFVLEREMPVSLAHRLKMGPPQNKLKS